MKARGDCTRAVLSGEAQALRYVVATMPRRPVARYMGAVARLREAERALAAHDGGETRRKDG